MNTRTSSAAPTGCITWFIPGTTPSSSTSPLTMHGLTSAANDQPVASPCQLRNDHLPGAAFFRLAQELADRTIGCIAGRQLHSAGRVIVGRLFAQLH
ncbi:hypothetical protein D3C84_1130470 [compost metagenome]